MLKHITVIFGVILIIIGIIGFVPALTPNGLLLGLFLVDPIHNSIHLLIGIIALIISTKGAYAKIFLQVFGIIYALIAIIGFMTGGNLILTHVNIADNWLHLVIAIIALYYGFIAKPKTDV